MNHSLTQIVKNIICKWYIALAIVVVVVAGGFAVSKIVPGNNTYKYKAVVLPQSYYDQVNSLKVDSDGYLSLITNNSEIIQAVIDSDKDLKDNLKVENIIGSLTVEKKGTSLEAVFSNSNKEIAEKFMTAYFGSDDAVGMTKLNEVYHIKFPDYEVGSGSTAKPVKRGDAKINTSAYLQSVVSNTSMLKLLIIFGTAGVALACLVVTLPILLKKVDYNDENLIKEFNVKILGSINDLEAKND